MDKIAALVLLFLVMAGSAYAESSLETWQPYVAEASARFGMPETWVRSVIVAESGGDPKAVSSKGAMGLMQLMPDTWKDMHSLHGLGPDPFDPKANILGGTAYLKAMFDHFGYPALFAAYNAGAARYEDHLRTGKPLPEETVAYVAEIEKRLGFTPQFSVKIAETERLFFRLSTIGNGELKAANSIPALGLFVRISTGRAGDR